MKTIATRTAVVTAILVASLSSSTLAKEGSQGITYQGITYQGGGLQGITYQGITYQGITYQGITYQGTGKQGITYQGITYQGITYQGITYQGITYQGITYQGITYQGITYQGITYQGPALRGTDRLAKLGPVVEFQRLELPSLTAPIGAAGPHLVLVPRTESSVQGLQPNGTPPTFRELEVDPDKVQLQASPGDTNHGDYIFVPNLIVDPAQDPRGTKALTGTFWSAVVANGGAKGSLPLYVADVEIDSSKNSSKYPSNSDIYLYTVYLLDPVTQQWMAACPNDDSGKPRAMAIPVDPFKRTAASRKQFTFACTASGVAAKCARNWGYKPWKTVYETLLVSGQPVANQPVDLAPLYDACLIAARADYCQDGQSFTKNGTLVDLFDSIDGVASINSTAGIPYAPNSPGPMLHEEYQISTANHVFTPAEIMSVSTEPEHSLRERLLHSGMQSSRYADLDPGRSCFAAPYIDRCDPKEPYACYRAANMGSRPYGAFIAVNSPRHCSHDELHYGEALDPLCNECVNRICQLDPTCCADPGPGFYPGSLVWDSRCSTLQAKVCRSAPFDPTLPADHPYNKPWAPGAVAEPAGSRPPVFQSGAIGSFEQIVSSGMTTVAEGWACDPDFPGASIPVQISVGGPLGTTTTPPITAVADQPLAAEWRAAAAAACGGNGRHGFKVPVQAGQKIFIYGIDLNVPGAPFTLLRGGTKTVPGAALSAPGAVIWTGWVEPTQSGNYVFCKQATGGGCVPMPAPANPLGSDRYRVWVNGFYVAGNWVDAPAAGAFQEPPPGGVSLYLQSGVRYGVRIEYQTAPSSGFGLLWSKDGAAFTSADGAFHPVAQGVGNGLLGTFYTSTDFTGSPAGQSIAVVDKTWTVGDLPADGISLGLGFSGTFEGQVVPPISGDYTFTADTDGRVKIFVNGKLVTDASRRPPGSGNADVCSHDICRPGPYISSRCNQGNFCAYQICQKDATCCSITWDEQCVQQVATICKLACTPTPPVPISLRAGVKYDIRVEYTHDAGNGASLHLMWSLPGGRRDVIPVERLFAARDVTGAPAGVGLNAAYFRNADFTDEYVDRVERTPTYAADSAPSVVRTQSILCAAPCADAGDVLGPPALTRPVSGTTVAEPNVTIEGMGASPGAEITLFENGAQIGSLTNASAVGKFSVPVQLSNDTHSITAKQKFGGKTSAESPPLVVVVGRPFDPDAPPIPSVDVPPGGLVSTTNQVAIGGKGTSGGRVTVKQGDTIVGTFDVVDGQWGGLVTLSGPGSYTLSVTETIGAHTSPDGPGINARVTLPSLIVDTPTDGVVDNPVVEIRGSAQPDVGPVFVGDGDGRFFGERASLTLTNGTFTGSLKLDYGRHVLKFFQRFGGLDGDGVVRVVSVRPPNDTLAITKIVSPTDGELNLSPVPTIDQNVSVKGGGGLRRTAPNANTSMRGSAIVYQGTTPVGEGPLDDDGNFNVPVVLKGAGNQLLSVAQVAHSLSGGGTEKSRPSESVMVTLRPPRPVITLPVTGTKQTSRDVRIEGEALPDADVTIAVDDKDKTTVQAKATDPLRPEVGLFGTTLTLENGSHRLKAYQALNSTRGLDSDVVVVAVGDVTPPTLEVVRADCAARRDADPTVECPAVRELKLPEEGDPAADDTGTGVVLATKLRISASDDGASLPVTCLPSATTTGHFPLGSSNVTCEATDLANNRASTTVVVTVRSDNGPVIADGSVTVEAISADGAVVNYPLAATGWIVDCAPPGVPEVVACTSWKPANKGLGFAPSAIAVNATNGTLYTGFFGDAEPTLTNFGSFLTSTNQGGSWMNKAPPMAAPINQILWVGGPTPTLYIPSYFTGIRISTDDGASWTSALAGIDIMGIAVDPRDPKHLVAWTALNGRRDVPLTSTVFETYDGWVTWSDVTEGLPNGVDELGHGLPETQIAGLAIDPLDSTRMYLSLRSTNDSFSTAWMLHLYRKLGNAPWELLDVPPESANSMVHFNDKTGLAVAPWRTPCDPQPGAPACPTHPTVFVSSLMSIDGGKEWKPIPFATSTNSLEFMFDRAVPGTIYASTGSGIQRSLDYGQSWTLIGGNLLVASLAQDAQQPNTLYATSLIGIFKSIDGGATWVPMLAPDQSLTRTFVGDIVADPVNPQVAYLISASGGIFKTINGGESWVAASNGFSTLGWLFLGRLAIDPFDTNTIYASGGAAFPASRMWKTLDGAGDVGWTQLDRRGVLELDPTAKDTMYLGNSSETSDSYWFGLSKYVGSVGMEITSRDWPEGGYFSGEIVPFDLQAIPDAAHNVIVSWQHDGSGEFGVQLVSTADGVVDRIAHGIGGSTNVLYDGSDGTQSLFTGGVGGADQSYLFRAPVSENPDWQLVGGGPEMNGGVSFTDFSRLIVDPASAGRTMYTLGVGDSLWQTSNGGRTWRADAGAPSFMTQVWLSPVDGALYANVRSNPTTAEERARQRTTVALNSSGLGTIWKRTFVKGTPPGARVLQGDVRVTCTGGSGGPVAPGSMFPMGDTTLTCTATDVFNNTSTRPITITVRDSTPPKITTPPPVIYSGTPPLNVDFTVSATDTVDGPTPVSCDHEPGSVFEHDVTTVTCTASDKAGNVGTASFPVVIAFNWPTITIPDQVVAEATGRDNTIVTFDARAVDGFNQQIPVNCSPPSGSAFGVGVTPVECSATSEVTLTRSFNVVVRDTTPPVIHLPPPDNRSAKAAGAHGARFDYTVTADDLVSGSVAVECVPESGSTFPLGKTTVVCRAADTAGNRATAEFEVTIADFNPPVLHLDPLDPIEAQDQTGAFVTYKVTATDAEDGPIDPDCLPLSGSWFPMHETTVVCTATDSAGNEGRLSFVVQVVDQTAPAIIVPRTITVEAEGPDGTVVNFPLVVSDAVDGPATPAPRCTRVTGLGVPTPVAPGATFPLGDSTITCTSTDAAGNVGTATFTIVVRDTTIPTLHLPDPITATADASGTAIVPFSATADDIVAGALPVGCTPKPGSRFLPGTTNVDCSARDGARNEARGSFTVTVFIGDRRGQPCSVTSPCGGTLVCVDGVCCENGCGGGLATDCRACSVAAGGSLDGTCTPVVAGRICRASAGACDVAEACDGTAETCPSDGFADAGATCRPSAGACDVVETCTGSSATCPDDTFAPPAQVCRAAASICDVAETCTGASATCPGDMFAPPTQICRAAGGACDVAESCTGNSASCPPDAFAPPTQLCRAPASVCDVAESCTGTSPICPVDALSPPTTVCRAAAGACDVAETCTGSSPICPADALSPPTAVCRPSAGACDPAERCTGGSSACPADAFAPPTQTCRPPAGTCDVAETCTGTSAACPLDTFAAAGTVCAAAGTCQTAGVCSGSTATCPGPTPIPGCRVDTTPPYWVNVPGTIVAYATSTQGAIVTYTNARAIDAVDGERPVSCTATPGSMFHVNKTDVTCTASDKSGNSSSVTFTVWVKYKAPTDGTFFLQPINPDGTSIFKQGSTVPVKFKLEGVSAGITNLVARLLTAKVKDTVTGNFVETTSTSAADSGNTFRYDAGAKQYIFNLSTKSMSKGTWSLRADLGDGVEHTVYVSLK